MTEQQVQRCVSEFAKVFEAVPSYWDEWSPYGPAGYRWRHSITHDMTVVLSVSYQLDGKCWLHASIAREKTMPSYGDLVKLKSEFIGEDRKAVMVLPCKAEHINIHNFALHLFCCLDDDPLPDFTQGSGSL